MKRIVLLVLLLPMLALGQEAFTGTWKADLNEVKFSQKPDQVILKDGRFQCSTCVPKLDVKADGKDQPVSGSKYFDTIAVRAIDNHSVQSTSKKDGKVVSEATRTLSPDGNTLTEDFKFYPPKGDPVTGKVISTRVDKAPAGAHPISGSWRTNKAESISESGLTVTFKGTPNGLSMNSPTGESYDAKFDGKEYPVNGDRGGSKVIVKKVNDRTIEETTKRDGKVVAVNEMTVAPDGKTMKVVATDKERGTTMSWSAKKQ